jgi:streptogramin lyase
MDPNGNVWFTLARADAMARVAPDGTFTTFPLPQFAFGRAVPNDVVLGPDGALWITEYIGNVIVRMDLNGNVTNVYPLSTEAGPRFIAVGQDGNLWFTEIGSEALAGDPYTPPQIIKMTTSGQMTAYAEPPSSEADSLRPATGGFVFADLGANAVGLIDYSGNIVEWPIVYDGGTYGNTQFAVQGADGAYYFADADLDRIGKITLGKKGAIFPQTFSVAPGGTQFVGVAVLGDRGPYTATIDNTSVATVAPISGFPMNFTVTGVAPGTATLTIKGKGKAMTAAITVTSAVTTNARTRKHPVGRVAI